ncbi:MAG: ECF-type sigma factor [Aureliella sp.]
MHLPSTPELESGGSTDDFFQCVYQELHRIAKSKMVSERLEHTLSATALVNEAYVRVRGGHRQQWDSRGHFFTAAAEAMRRVLIDRARAKNSAKRKGVRQYVNLADIQSVRDIDADRMIEIDDKLDLLQQVDDQAANFLKLRLFAGLNNIEAGEALGLTSWSSYKTWDFIQAWFACHTSDKLES